jgi:hypothetical protein
MATKPVISIDVDDSKFAKFKALFDEYVSALGDQPAAWDAINDSSAKAGDALKAGALSGKEALSEAASEAARVQEHLQGATRAQLLFARATADHRQGFADLEKTGKSAWQAIGGAADASIMKTASGLTGILSSLGPIGVGVGTVLGVAIAGVTAAKALADSAVDRQRSAFGLGTTTGKQSSFGVYGQQFFGDGQQALQAATNVQSNLGNAGALGALGIDFNRARKMSKSDLSFEMIRQAVRIANASPDLPMGNNPLLAQYAALTGDKDFDQLRNAQEMLKTDPRALDKAQAETNRNAARMELNRGAVANAALLKKATEAAGVTAQTWLINNTSGADPKAAKALDAISGDPRAQADVVGAAKRFGDEIDAKAVPATQHFVHALNVASGGLLHESKGGINALNAATNAATGGALTSDAVHAKLRQMFPGAAAWYDKERGTLGITGGYGSSVKDAIAAVAIKKGVDPYLAIADATHESGLNPQSRGDYGRFDGNGNFVPMRAGAAGGRYTSFGLFQLHEGGELGNLSQQQAFDPATNAERALSEFSAVMHMSSKELVQRERVLGVSDWSSDASKLSPGQVAALAERPKDAAGYAKIVDAIYAKERATRKPTINVTVSNSTASRVSVAVKGANP